MLEDVDVCFETFVALKGKVCPHLWERYVGEVRLEEGIAFLIVIIGGGGCNDAKSMLGKSKSTIFSSF